MTRVYLLGRVICDHEFTKLVIHKSFPAVPSRIDLFLRHPVFVPQPYTTEEWVVLASVIHDGKYDYSNVDYRGSKTDVEVICLEPGHGPFLVQPHRHTGERRKGCPICNPPKRRAVDTSVFIEDAIEVHGDKYDYSKVDYQGMKTECEIICPEHKSFYRNYRSHIRN